MIEKQQLIQHALALNEAALSLAKWESHEDCVKVMQVMAEVAMSSVAMNISLDAALTMMCDAIAAVSKSHGGVVTIDLRKDEKCSKQKH